MWVVRRCSEHSLPEAAYTRTPRIFNPRRNDLARCASVLRRVREELREAFADAWVLLDKHRGMGVEEPEIRTLGDRYCSMLCASPGGLTAWLLLALRLLRL